MTTVQVALRQSYDIVIGSGFLPKIGEKVKSHLPTAEKIAVITDENIAPIYLDVVAKSLSDKGFEVVPLVIPPGEASKSGTQYLSLLSALAEAQLTRTDAVIALGGGVVGDLAGFVAATYLRGIPFIQIPTTLLAAVDSSVGGKTAIDLPTGKNLVGAFYQPCLVLCDIDVFRTLPDDVLHSGYSEVIKYGMLGSADILTQLQSIALDTHIALSDDSLESLIAACVSIKRDLVQKDEFDIGDRQLLNLGHTIGHAIERLDDYNISHGYAVAIGMAIITRAAVRKSTCPPECLEILDKLLFKFSLPNQTDFPPEILFKASLSDKKRAGKIITEVIPISLGKSELNKMPIESLLDWIESGWKA